MMTDFGEPLFLNVLERSGRVDGKADQEDVGLRVGQRAQTVVVFLPGGVEQSQSVRLIADPVEGQSQMELLWVEADAYITVTA